MSFNNEKYVRGSDESYSEYAYRAIRDSIMKFDLAPGMPINEADIAEALKVSRTPVHEALARLRDENLVDIQPRKESRVTKIDLVLVNDGIFMRSCVEPELIDTLKGNIAAPIMHRMLKNINRQREILLGENARSEFNDADDEFHQLLYLAANRENLYPQVRAIVTHFDRVRYLARLNTDFAEVDAHSYQEHREIFGAVAYRAELMMSAHELVRRHITRFQNYIDELTDKFRDYFIMR